ncbi:MAG: porin family protein [Myxococcota bacterium]|nr:porin family protein [Myxococcota bacterium]
MQRIAILISLLAAFSLTSMAQAQEEYSYPGPYVQLAGSYARCSFNLTDRSGGECNDGLESSLGLNGRIGFRFNRFLTVEGQIEWISGFDAKAETLPAPTPGVPTTTEASAEAITYTINVRFYPIEGRIQPYAIAGLGGENVWLNSNVVDSDTFTSFVGRFGAGLDIYLTNHLALTGEFTYVAATEAKATYYGYWWDDYFTVNSGVDPSYMSVSWGLLYSF